MKELFTSVGAISLASLLAIPASLALTTTPAAPAAWSIVAGLAMYSIGKGLKVR